jgi:hypothetical protein
MIPSASLVFSKVAMTTAQRILVRQHPSVCSYVLQYASASEDAVIDHWILNPG